jgi:hypothetical protein
MRAILGIRIPYTLQKSQAGSSFLPLNGPFLVLTLHIKNIKHTKKVSYNQFVYGKFSLFKEDMNEGFMRNQKLQAIGDKMRII